jgi:hypothetical protein
MPGQINRARRDPRTQPPQVPSRIEFFVRRAPVQPHHRRRGRLPIRMRQQRRDRAIQTNDTSRGSQARKGVGKRGITQRRAWHRLQCAFSRVREGFQVPTRSSTPLFALLILASLTSPPSPRARSPWAASSPSHAPQSTRSAATTRSRTRASRPPRFGTATPSSSQRAARSVCKSLLEAGLSAPVAFLMGANSSTRSVSYTIESRTSRAHRTRTARVSRRCSSPA